MSRTHVVKQGESLPDIAALYGIGDYRLLYDASANAGLKRRRPDPNVLFPGDEVTIPDPVPKEESAQTGQVAAFSVTLPKRLLRLTLKDHSHRPLGSEAYVFAIQGQTGREGSTDGAGKIEEPVPLGAKEGTLRVRGRVYRLLLGHLNPTSDVPDGDVTGVQARLKNLGYYGGPIDGQAAKATKLAIALFQDDARLPVDGEPNANTLRKLEEEYGA